MSNPLKHDDIKVLIESGFKFNLYVNTRGFEGIICSKILGQKTIGGQRILLLENQSKVSLGIVSNIVGPIEG